MTTIEKLKRATNAVYALRDHAIDTNGTATVEDMALVLLVSAIKELEQ
jgi:hypothetical protein